MADLVIQDSFEPYYAGREAKAAKPAPSTPVKRRAEADKPADAAEGMQREADDARPRN